MSEPASDRKAPDHLIGQTLANRYQIEQRLGEGAMGTVYRARHVKVGRPFAVKVLHSRLLDDNKVAQRFEREAELAGRLSHANVVGVVDVGETPDGLRYMVMDFAEGEDLAELLIEAPFTRERIIHLVRQLLEGLFHAHEAGLIHRDFKPENVIIAKDDHGKEVPRIVDLGIAILREGGESSTAEGRLTTNGLVLGTPHYMAPEQAVADPIDHRIDLFALGIVIYEMLCGKLPFDGTGAEVARANLMTDPPPIAKRVPYLEVDPLLEAFARKLMAKRRDQRPASARVARELLDLIERDPTAAAGALGVPAPMRAPATTQPLRELAPAPEDSADLPVARAPEPDEVEPIPMTPTPVAQRAISTQTAEPLAYALPKRRRTGLLALGAVLLLGGAIAIVAVKSGGKQPAAPDQKVVMTPTQPSEPRPAPVERAMEPPPPAEIDMPAPPTPVPKKPVVVAKELPKKPPPPVETPARPAPSKTELNALYRAVGGDIAAAGSRHGADAVAELWRRYRMIQIQDAGTSEVSRREAAGVLLELRKDAKQ